MAALGVDSCYQNNHHRQLAICGNQKTHHHQSNSRKRKVEEYVDDEYEVVDVINRGSYGVVYRGRKKKTGEIVAMKHELHGFSRSTLREIGVLMSLPPHPSIVEFKDVHQEEDNHGGRVFVVMEYLETDLKRFMEKRSRSKPLTISQVKYMMKRILEGVDFLHSKGVMHRDLKPSNILMNNKGDVLKICDFGLSRALESESGSYTPYVVTLWYRSPELLYGRRNYSSAIDMWSVGCIMGEMILNQVVFQGDSEVNQLWWVCYINSAGTYNMLRHRLAAAASRPGAPLLTASGFDLLQRLLAFFPDERITAKDALTHDWFNE